MRKTMDSARIGLHLTLAVIFGVSVALVGSTQADTISAQGKILKNRAADLDKIYTCKSVPKGVPTTTVVVHLEKFSIPADWTENGDHYEVKIMSYFSVYPDGQSKKVICQGGGDWGEREFRKYNAWSGDRWHYALDFKVIVHNVPVQGLLWFDVSMYEIDNFLFTRGITRDWIDIGPSPTRSNVDIKTYPAKKVAYVMGAGDQEINDSQHLIGFGKSKRILGDGKGPKVDVAGSLDLTIDIADSYAANPGIGPKVGGAKKVGGATKKQSLNLPCQQYALTAVKLNGDAAKLGCGFKPPVWSNDHQMHFDWCSHGDNAAEAAGANATRQKELAACQTTAAAKSKAVVAGKEKTCRDYALTAVNLNQQAVQIGCGFKPPVWSNDHQMHFDWCMHGNNDKTAATENTKRTGAIAACKTQLAQKPAAPPKPGAQSAAQYCQVYAQDAINQFHTAQQRSCVLLGPEWSPDYNWHYNWCVSTYQAGNIQTIAAGTAKRNSMLATCQ